MRRREILLGAAAGVAGVGCAPGQDGGAVGVAEVYVGLARARSVAVVDVASDEVRRRIPLTALGERGLPWQIGVGPVGNAAVLPLTVSAGVGPQIGVIGEAEQARGGGAGGRRERARTSHGGRCEVVGVGTGGARTRSVSFAEAAQALTADARGRAYVLVSDGWGGLGGGASYAAVVDLRSGAVLRHLPVAAAGEIVLALLAVPDGTRLLAAVWTPELAVGSWRAGSGRLVALDTATGQQRARAVLPAHAAVTDLAVGALPPGAAGAGVAGEQAVYAVVAEPGPAVEEDEWWAPGTGFWLTAFGAERLDEVGTWPLDQRPSALAVLPDGRRAYLLGGAYAGPWPRHLSSLDLAGGAVTRRWPLPEGARALAVSPAGKAYVADALGDRLWRVDTRTDTLLGSIPMPGVPLAVAARPG